MSDDSSFEDYTPEPVLTGKDIFSVTREKLSWDHAGTCADIYDSLYIIFSIKNISDKTVDAVDMSAEISDEFGDSLKTVNMQSSATISPNKSIRVGSTGSHCYKLNNYESGDNVILNWSAGDQGTLTLNLDRIKFDDGSIEDYYGEEIYTESFTVN